MRQSPQTHFDGTLIVQKALSALLRLNEKVGTNTLIDVLRGSAKAGIMEAGYHQIKTYGAGADISFDNWQQYILQMVNIGLVEIAYDEGMSLKVSAYGREVLNSRQSLQLVVLQPKEVKAVAKKERGKRNTVRSEYDELFENLRKLRYSIALSQNVPAYVVSIRMPP